jgi:hypothetical protein
MVPKTGISLEELVNRNPYPENRVYHKTPTTKLV